MNALRIDAARAQGLAQSQTQVDIEMFIQWANAYAHDDQPARGLLQRPLPRRVPPRLRRLAGHQAAHQPGRAADPVRAWTSTSSPHEPRPTSYDAQAEAQSAKVRVDIQRASNYVLGVVLFAVALFFAGMSTKLKGVGVRTALLVVGCALFIGTAAWIATFPVNIAV